MDFDIWSREATHAAAVIEDSEGARFINLFMVEPKQWQHVSLAPSDFKLTDDSPVKKQFLDPMLATKGLMLADVGTLFGAFNDKILRIKNLRHQTGRSH